MTARNLDKNKDKKNSKAKNNYVADSASSQEAIPSGQETEKNNESISSQNLSRPEKNKMFLKTIEIRLDGVGEATKRVKITYIISIIASCAMLITVFNAYFSFTRTRAFDNSYKYKASDKTDWSKLIAEPENEKHFIGLINYLSERKDVKLNLDGAAPQDKSPDKNEQKNLKETPKIIRDIINENLLEDKGFYNVISRIDTKDFHRLFFTKEKIPYQPSQAIDNTNLAEVDKLKKKIERKISKSENKYILDYLFDDDTPTYYDATNHLNKFIIGRIFPEIVWETEFAGKDTPISLYEENKKALARQWVENQNVRIDLLGLSVNVDQFSLIGSFTLMTISIWMLFSFRRENRSIVSLLRDVRDEVNKPDEYGKDSSDEWDIANLTFQGIVHKLVFSQTGQDDLPMSEGNIFSVEEKDSGETGSERIWERIKSNPLDYLVAGFTWLARWFAYILLFLPFFSICIILFVDYFTTTYTLFPYSNNPIEYFINRNTNDLPKIMREIYFGIFFGVVTLLVGISCFILQKRTESALRGFEDKLKGQIPKKLK